MQISTKYHGTREYKEEDIITFKKGVPGFEEYRKFIVFPVEDNELFSVFHSIENSDIGLVVVSPFVVDKNYAIDLSDDVVEELKIEDSKDVLIVNTVTLNSKIENITVNLKAPIIINIKSQLGEQIILNEEKYAIKHPLYRE